MSKQRPINELNATLSLTPGLGALPMEAELHGLPVAAASGASWHRGRTAEGEMVLVFSSRGDFAVDVADAGRRAMLVTAPALVPIRSVDEFFEADGTPVTVVTYEDPKSPSLRELAAPRALRPETARSIAGQVTEALETARRRGVRHRFLDDSRVFVDVDADQVRIVGAGVEAAASDDSFSNVDALAVNPDVRSVGLILFVGLTGRVPKFFGSDDVIDPGVASSRTVPEDLRIVTTNLLTHEGTDSDNPPYTLRAARSDLAPWQSLPVTLEAFDPEQHAGPPVPLDSETLARAKAGFSGAGDAGQPGASQAPGASGDAPAESGAAGPQEPVSASDDDPTAVRAAVAAPAAARPTDSENVDTARDTSASTVSPASDSQEEAAQGGASPSKEAPASRPWGDLVAGGAAATAAAAGAASLSRNGSNGQSKAGDDPGNSDASGTQGPIRVAGRSSSLAATLGTPGKKPDFSTRASQQPSAPGQAPAPGASQLAAQRPSVVPPSAIPQPEQPEPIGIIPVKGRRPDEAPSTASTDDSSSLLREVVGVALGSDSAGSTRATSGSSNGVEGKIVLGAAIIGLIVALVIALTIITSVGRDRNVESNPTTAATPSATAAPTQAASQAPTPKEEQKPAAAAAKLDAVEVVYPGDQSKADYPEKAGLLTDGDPGSVWKTKRYKSPNYGGLRNGMGLLLKLGNGGTVKEVGISAGDQEGGTIEVRKVAEGNTVGEVVGTGQLTRGKETVITLNQPVEAKELFLWAPDLGAVDGGYRLEISEVRVG